MSETDTYYRYHKDRVLITTARMYRPMFAPAVVQLTGAQVEMLRNMTQYLNRPNTYVEEYEVDKYLTPDSGQFDGIQAIVADLEEKLMGNENVIWGYQDRLAEKQQNYDTPAGINYLLFPLVPAGEVWVLTSITWVNTVTDPPVSYAQIYNDPDEWNIHSKTLAGANVYYSITCHVPLKEDDRLRVGFNGCALHDAIYAWTTGYKMDVP